MLKYTLAVLACLLGVGLSAVVQDTKPVVQDTSKCCLPDKYTVKMTQTSVVKGNDYGFGTSQMGIMYADVKGNRRALFMNGVEISGGGRATMFQMYNLGTDLYSYIKDLNMCFKSAVEASNDRCMPADAVKTGERTYGEEDKTLKTDVYKYSKTVSGKYSSAVTMDMIQGICSPMTMAARLVQEGDNQEIVQFTAAFYDAVNDMKDDSVFDLPEPCKNAIMIKSDQLPVHMRAAMHSFGY